MIDPKPNNFEDLSSPTRFFSDPERRAQLVRFLLDNGGTQQLNCKDATGWTPLHHALTNPPLVKIMVEEYGANVNATDYTGQTALHMMCRGQVWGDAGERPGDLEVIGILLDHRADKEARDYEGWTPLLRACVDGNVQIAKILAERGANLNSRASEGRTPLHLLLQDHEGDTRRSINVSDILQVFLERGANVNAEDRYGFTPLHQAALSGNGAFVKGLLKHGANVKAITNDHHMTPLLLASHHDQFDALQVLLESSDISATNCSGDTILHLATSVPTAQCIVEQGAHHSAKDRARLLVTKNHLGKTPLDVAKQRMEDGPDSLSSQSAQLKEYLESYTAYSLAVSLALEDGVEVDRYEHSVKMNDNLTEVQRQWAQEIHDLLYETDAHPVVYVILGYLCPADVMVR